MFSDASNTDDLKMYRKEKNNNSLEQRHQTDASARRGANTVRGTL